MSEDKKNDLAKLDRQRRLEERLRDNLRRRKEQARARRAEDETAEGQRPERKDQGGR